MHVLIAPDSYKGTFAARQVGNIIAGAIREANPAITCTVLPMADGGEGTMEALIHATSGRLVPIQATGPLGEPVRTHYGLLGDGQTAVIEAAAIAGLTMVPPERRNPLHTTTSGMGEAIRLALDRGIRQFIVGLGGSATNDGGLGMLSALGMQFLDGEGRPVPPYPSALPQIQRVIRERIDPRLASSHIQVACDVDNPLCGPQGASAVYGPQKGATPGQVAWLDRALSRYASLVEQAVGISAQHLPGAGAAGGLGFALLMLGARLVSGAKLVADTVGLDAHLIQADLVITGEGRTDGQTLRGKLPWVVAQRAQSTGVPVVLLSGHIDPAVRQRLTPPFHRLYALTDGATAEEALTRAPELLAEKAREILAHDGNLRKS